MSDKKQVFLSLETARKMWKENMLESDTNASITTFLLSNFTKAELEAKELPKSWKELKTIKGYYVTANSKIIEINADIENEHRNIFPTKELAKASLALSQLLQLRDVYNGDWKVDLNNRPHETRYVICNRSNNIDIDLNYTAGSSFNKTLSFQKESIRDQFAENFKDLITQALPLL